MHLIPYLTMTTERQRDGKAGLRLDQGIPHLNIICKPLYHLNGMLKRHPDKCIYTNCAITLYDSMNHSTEPTHSLRIEAHVGLYHSPCPDLHAVCFTHYSSSSPRTTALKDRFRVESKYRKAKWPENNASGQ